VCTQVHYNEWPGPAAAAAGGAALRLAAHLCMLLRRAPHNFLSVVRAMAVG